MAMTKTIMAASTLALAITLSGCGDSTEGTTQTGSNSGGQTGGNTAEYPSTPGPDGASTPGLTEIDMSDGFTASVPNLSDPEAVEPGQGGTVGGSGNLLTEADNGDGGSFGGPGFTEAANEAFEDISRGDDALIPCNPVVEACPTPAKPSVEAADGNEGTGG